MPQIQLDPEQESDSVDKSNLIWNLEYKRHQNSISSEKIAFLIWPFAFFIALLVPTVVIFGTLIGLFHVANQLTETLLATFFTSGICALVGVIFFRYSQASTKRVNDSHKNLLEDTKLDGMHDPSLDEKRHADSEAQEEIKRLQYTIVAIVKTRYPELIDLAQEKVEKIDDSGILNNIIAQIISASDKLMMRWLTSPSRVELKKGSTRNREMKKGREVGNVNKNLKKSHRRTS
jgi:hypothetical protein